ncbi:MAG: hypothetical protein AAFO69_11340 [Bacteroidota bacterium]
MKTPTLEESTSFRDDIGENTNIGPIASTFIARRYRDRAQLSYCNPDNLPGETYRGPVRGFLRD